MGVTIAPLHHIASHQARVPVDTVFHPQMPTSSVATFLIFSAGCRRVLVQCFRIP